MAILFTESHIEDINFLTKKSPKIMISIAKISLDYLLNGSNDHNYTIVADKLDIEANDVQYLVEVFAYLLLESFKYKVSDSDLVKMFENANFSESHISAFVKFYESSKSKLEKLFLKESETDFFYDLQWRFEAKIASRSVFSQMNPIVTLNLRTANSSEALSTTNIKNRTLQADPNTLIHVTNTLEKALQYAQSSAAKKMEKKVQKLMQE